MSITGSRNKALTYVLLVILIALWAMVLLPPYLKDRRASGRTFRSGGRSSLPGGLPSASNSAQRFLPLQQATNASQFGARSSGSSSTIDLRGSGRPGIAARRATPNLHASALPSSNVVHLRPVSAPTSPAPVAGPPRAPATSAAEYLADAPATSVEAMSPEERALHAAFDAPNAGLRMPSSTAAARERRRQILLGLTGLAIGTFLLAYFAGGLWIAAHVFVDIVMLGYVILLVRHRQLAADRKLKVEPIRPPVTEQAPATLQAAPSYLVRSNTGS